MAVGICIHLIIPLTWSIQGRFNSGRASKSQYNIEIGPVLGAFAAFFKILRNTTKIVELFLLLAGNVASYVPGCITLAKQQCLVYCLYLFLPVLFSRTAWLDGCDVFRA